MSTNATASSHPTTQGYVPVEEWPELTTMVEGFGDPSLPASDRLDGQTLSIRFENGWTITHAFENGDITWEIVAGDALGATGTHAYRAVEVRPEILFVDFVKGEGAHTSNVSMLIDLRDGRVTVADSTFVDRNGAVRMATEFLHGQIGDGEITPRSETTELVGKRIYYRYSPTEHYEHVYLNAGTFVWHCVRGGEVGLADADPIRVFAVDEDLVLLHWSETVMPVESIVAIDLAQHRSIGRMFCWDGPTLAPLRIPFDSKFTVLESTQYPED